MSPNIANYILSGIMIFAGIGIPIMASLNAGLGLRLGTPAAGNARSIFDHGDFSNMATTISGDAITFLTTNL